MKIRIAILPEKRHSSAADQGDARAVIGASQTKSKQVKASKISEVRMFFFEKKNQKTFANSPRWRIRGREW
jgi:hypothetical protein